MYFDSNKSWVLSNDLPTGGLWYQQKDANMDSVAANIKIEHYKITGSDIKYDFDIQEIILVIYPT